MMRVLLIALTVVIAVLALILNQAWMYWAAGAFLVAAVAAIVARMWRRYQEAVRFRREEGASIKRHPDLGELGITEIRARREPSNSSSRKPADSGTETEPDEAEATKAAPARSAEEAPADDEMTATRAADEPSASAAPDDTVDEQPAQEPAGAPEEESEDPVLQPYLQALRAATESHAACLLVQEDVVLSYRIEAAVSRGTPIRTTGTFEADEPLLSASMTQVDVTVQPVGRDGVDPSRLGYYEKVPVLKQVVFAPVPTPSAASTCFLVLDATDTHLAHPRAKKLITHFADLLGILIESEASTSPPVEPDVLADAEDETPPRPRREIIAEEIQEAQRTSSHLALALVHLNRAEQLSQEGKAVIADAESALRARLERSAPRSRIERFGELTYGVFYNGDVADVEPWAERLQEEMDGIGGVLAGGVSIGVAMLREEIQSPDQLREDATEALRMAYETGTCTIVE